MRHDPSVPIARFSKSIKKVYEANRARLRSVQARIAKPLALAALVGGLISLTCPAQAVDLSHRLGVGYKNQFSSDLPSLAVQYYPGREVGLSLELGVDTLKDQSQFGVMAKIHRIIFEEENMNFYMGSGLGLISQETAGHNDSGFELLGFAGGEFFLTGLKNLGFSFEMGAGVTSVSSQVRFRTFGDSPLRAGITFYF